MKNKKDNLKEDESLKQSIDVEELIDVEEIESVLGEDKEETIESSEKEKTPFQILLEKGKSEGFITYAELNENLPEGIIEADRLEEIVEMISDLGIVVQEHAPKSEEIASNQTNQEDAINPIENEIGKTTDPVRMYMREMGTIELLDREGEIVIAKKIEDGNKKIQATLSAFIPVLEFIHERYKTVLEDIEAQEEKDQSKILEIFSDYAYLNDDIIEINSDNQAEEVAIDVSAINKEIKKVIRQTNRLIKLIDEDAKIEAIEKQRANIEDTIMSVKISPKLFDILQKIIIAYMDEVKRLEGEIREIVVETAGVPMDEFRKTFIGNETKLTWIDKYIRAKRKLSLIHI